jgi:hypothetical protein
MDDERASGVRPHACGSCELSLLRVGVRHALRAGLGLVACGAMLGGATAAAAAPFPAVFPLARLLPAFGGDGSEGVVLRGIDRYDQSGSAVRGAGDVNGDGRDDLIIGAVSADQGTRRLAGEAAVVFGPLGGSSAVFELSSLLPANGGDGSAGFLLQGIDTYDFAGRSVGAAGDINGDGIGDVVVGADFADPDGRSSAGEIYVVFGRDTARDGDFPPVIPLASLFPDGGGDGSTGFVLTGARPFDQAGHAVSAAGDVNGDGFDDLLIGAFGADPGADYAGEAYVVFGRSAADGGFPAVFPLSSLFPGGGGDGSRGFVIAGVDLFDQAGIAVSGAGDVNGDGRDDVLVGARLASPGNRAYAGESFVVFGRDAFPAIFPLARLLPRAGGDGTQGFALTGVAAGDFSGAAVRMAGDVNGDGIDDLIVGAYRAGPDNRYGTGASYVVFGRDAFPPVVRLAGLLPGAGGDGSRGVVLAGIDPLDYSGSDVAGAGDLDGDGIDDVVVGAFAANGGGRQNAGEAYVVFGRDTAAGEGFPPLLPLATLLPPNGGDGSQGVVLTGIDEFDYAGYSVSAAGDVNGDGRDDLVVGALNADPSGRNYAGESYVIFGR